MAMSYPQQPAYPPQHQPPTPPPAAPPASKAKTWLWIIGVIGAFVLGIAAGAAGNTNSSSAPTTVTVTAGNPAVPTPVENEPPAPAGPATTMGPGTYQVGIDVQAGQYKTPGPKDTGPLGGCYWARLKNDSGEFDALISNANLNGPGSVTVNEGEFIELNGDCTWTKVG